MKLNFTSFKNLGPGLLFAGAAIGVSHLVQSTRAGADFGFGLIWALILVNLFKYPFFQFAPRYTTATGESLIEGYQRLGKGILVAYFILSLGTMFTIQAAVTIVTAGLAANLFGITDNVIIWSAVITFISFFILMIGKYQFLDKLMKIIVIVLTISSIIAVITAISATDKNFSFVQILPKGSVEIAFLIAFLGWMPAPLDVSVWQSLWTIEKNKDKTAQYNTKNALFDFNVGYISTIVVGILFIALGALVMYQTGKTFDSNAGKFAQQLISLYTENLGSGSFYIISIAAFTTMISTTITTLDASPRVMAKTTSLLFNEKISINYLIWMLLLSIGTILILTYFISNMIFLVKIATILSFLTAPFFAIANYTLITSKHTPKEWHPSLAMKILSYLGIIFLIGFSLWYLWSL
ncbi:MAG: Nramp family divalent metal transporter [Flavobacteriaceae bacterium]|nr:Nramp family divalent metal transporter [Flavobacteriaceae bacterium]